MNYELLCGVLILAVIALCLLLRGAMDRNGELGEEKRQAVAHMQISFGAMYKSLKEINRLKKELLEVKKQDKFLRDVIRKRAADRRETKRLLAHFKQEYKLLMDSWTQLHKDLQDKNFQSIGAFVNVAIAEETARRNNQECQQRAIESAAKAKPVYPWGELP